MRCTWPHSAVILKPILRTSRTKRTTNPVKTLTKAATLQFILTITLFCFLVKHAPVFQDGLRNRSANSLASPRASAAIPAPVFKGHFVAVAEADAQTVAAIAVATVAEAEIADAGASSAGPVAVAINRIAAITVMVIPDIRGVHN